MRKDARNCQGHGIILIIAVLHLFVREDMAIVDICMVALCWIALFPFMCASHRSDSTPDSKRAPLYVIYYRALRTVQAAHQIATACSQ